MKKNKYIKDFFKVPVDAVCQSFHGTAPFARGRLRSHAEAPGRLRPRFSDLRSSAHLSPDAFWSGCSLGAPDTRPQVEPRVPWCSQQVVTLRLGNTGQRCRKS